MQKEVSELLQRNPEGYFEVVVERKNVKSPVVIKNWPIFFSGKPMPTLYWLLSGSEYKEVSRIESLAGIKSLEESFDSVAVETINERYESMRDAIFPSFYTGIKPSGGVGGTTKGIKCLHAHLAWYLAGGDDDVGKRVADDIGLDLSDYFILESSF